LHFASTACHARRIVQLGEEPWRVTVSGAPGLDQLRRLKLLSVDELSAAANWAGRATAAGDAASCHAAV
jgi:hypothetical protein